VTEGGPAFAATGRKETSSLCPECGRVVGARVFPEGGRILIEKSCPDHGTFRDVYWSDAAAFERAAAFGADGRGIENPRTEARQGCPLDCGLCPRHLSETNLGIVDVTNRCNLRCPVCFADAAAARTVYEPTRDEIAGMLSNLRSTRPVPTPAVQFSGGEPTLRDDLPELVAMAKRAGFQNIEVNTNGLRMAESADYIRTLRAAGLDTVYLQFDGLTPDVHRALRGRDLTDVKRRVIENCRRAGMRSVVLVVTLVGGVNTGQLGDIVRFAVDNFDVVRCVNVQPLSFAGRVPEGRPEGPTHEAWGGQVQEGRPTHEAPDARNAGGTSSRELRGGQAPEGRRVTIPDVLALFESQTGGLVRAADFYPVPCEVPVARALGALMKERFPEFTAHPHCGAATYLVPRRGRLAPIGRVVKVDRMLRSLDSVAGLTGPGASLRGWLRMLASLRHVKPGLLRKNLRPLLRKGTFEALSALHYQMLMLSCMHFMDARNFDADRVRRCVIHYAAPDGRIIPFCSYNNLGYRREIEAAFGRPPASIYEGSHADR